jgi:lipoprotein-anchoring transpeptidase ErfK/SrfK
MRRRAGLAGLVLLGALAATVAIAAGPRAPAPVPVAAPVAPEPREPAFVPGRPRPLSSLRHRSHWAPVQEAVTARSAPDPGAAAVASLATRTPEGTRNAVAVLARRAGTDAMPWVRVRLPVLPNGTTGWVPRGALGGYATVRTRLDVDLTRLRATLFRDGRPLMEVAIGAGMPGWDTPRGDFYVRNKLTRYRSPAYGPVAFGTSARSPRATDWPAGGFVGIHGTDRPDLLPGRVSHGCIRMRNAEILALARRMPVGTPVRIF